MAEPAKGQLSERQSSGKVRWRGIVAVVACLSVFDVTLGLSYPLLAFILESRGFDALTIGLNAAMTSVGIVVAAPFVPLLAQRLGVWRFAAACILLTTLALALLKLIPDLAAWYVLRFLLGGAISGLFVVSEAWINELAGRSHRGRVVALYGSLLSLGFAAGPFLLAAIGPEGWLPFVAGIGCALLGLVPLFWARDSATIPERRAGAGFLAFLPQAPTMLAAVGVFALFDTATMSLLPVYGLRRGLAEATSANALGVLIVGNVILQYPIGWLADRLPRRAVMVGCALATAAGGLALPAAVGTLLLWPLLFFWGATALGVYTLAMVELGDRFKGSMLLAGAAAFAAMWGLGGIAGPPVAGAAMEYLGPEGLPWSLAAAFALLGVAALPGLYRR